jgi:hypothetical protein
MKSIIFWDMTPCSPLSSNRRFRGTYRLHLQGRRNRFSKNQQASKQVASRRFLLNLLLRPWKWRRYVPPKRRLKLNGLHDVISQKMITLQWTMVFRTHTKITEQLTKDFWTQAKNTEICVIIYMYVSVSHIIFNQFMYFYDIWCEHHATSGHITYSVFKYPTVDDTNMVPVRPYGIGAIWRYLMKRPEILHDSRVNHIYICLQWQ